MSRTTTLTFLLCCLSALVFSQSNNFNIKGSVTDTLNDPLIYATILLLEKQDSTMLEFSRTELDGSFLFKNISPGEYLVKTTYIGYIPTTIDATSLDGENLDLGQIKMNELAEELMTVVIKAAKAPIKMRGDTIEYDASTFQVPEGSTVEDLLKRLPGIEVEADGSILADGKNVNKVTVDGKSFFGSDPKAATKNLPAEGIGKVQVFDTKSEQEEITGATTESQDKTMNLELKEEFKKGAFGKVIAGIGDKDRKELKGNFNKFNKTIQFSMVGVGNNTGRNGLSWDDYQDFMGSQSFNFDNSTDYGFGGGSFYRTMRLGGGGGLESDIRSVFFNDNPNGGFPENYNGGLNFNFDDTKNKLSAVYYYNQAGLDQNGLSERERFYEGFVSNEQASNQRDNLSKAHRAELEFNKEIDSLHTVRFSFNGAQVNENKTTKENTRLKKDGLLTSVANTANDIDTEGYLANALILLRKKFKKEGRKMGLNASVLYTELEDDWTQNSKTTFLSKGALVDSTALINQLNNNLRDKTQFKANGLYVEPLSKRLFIQSFYNYSNRKENGNREVNDDLQNELFLNEDLSRVYENSIILNRFGSALRYSYNGMNVSVGLAYQHFDLDGLYSGLGASQINGTVEKEFINWIPHFSLNFKPMSNAYFNLNFSRNANEPSIQDLQPIVNNLNPQYIIEGNPSLTPEISNDFSLFFNKSYPLSGVRLSLGGGLNIYDNQFSTSEEVDEFLVTNAQPINVDGGRTLRFNAGINFPIIKNKITTRIRISGDQNIRPSLVNEVENNTTTWTYRPYVRFNITPSENIGVYLTARYSFMDTEYDINTSQNQKILNQTYAVEVTAKTFLGIFLNANLDYKRFSNDRFNVDRDIPVLDLSVYKQVLKGKRGEIRMSLYDSFNENLGFSSMDSFQTQNEAIGRYYMLSFTYNIRGVKSSAHKKGWW